MANQITVLLDPTQMPNQSQDQATFDALWAAVLAALPTFGQQFNAGIANLNASLNGVGLSIPYTIDLSSTADADPGNGKLRFGSATQNASTVLRLDLLSSNTADYTAVLDMFDASTNAVKGRICIVKQGDAKTFLAFDVTARTALSGYRNISVTPVASSSTNPFVNGDAVLLYFQRAGDRGNQGQGYTNMIVKTSTGAVNFPAGTTKAKITVQDGGYSGASQTGGTAQGGAGGNAGVSIITVDPAVTYTATVGAGGTASTSGTNSSPQPGGASTFSGTGLTTLTSANAALKIPGGQPPPAGTLGGYLTVGGCSMMGPASNGVPTGYGCGGGGAFQNSAGNAGAPGVITIEY